MVGGVLDNDKITESFDQYFQSVYHDPTPNSNFRILAINFSILDNPTVSLLSVSSAINQLNNICAPGLDEISLMSLIIKELMKLFHLFYPRFVFTENRKKSKQIILIPKQYSYA